MSLFYSLKLYYIIPKYGKDFSDSRLTPKAVYHAGIQMIEELQKLHEAGYTHNNITASSIVLDGDNIRLVGLGRVRRIESKSKELLRQDIWALEEKIDFKAYTPKSDMIMLTRFLLKEKYSTE